MMLHFTTPVESPGFQLWKVSSLWQRGVRNALKRYELTHTQFVVMAGVHWLTSQHGHLTQGDLAEAIRTDKMTTSSVLRMLVKRGLMFRRSNPDDARSKNIALTTRGIDVLEHAMDELEAFDRTFFGKLENPTSFVAELARMAEPARDLFPSAGSPSAKK